MNVKLKEPEMIRTIVKSVLKTAFTEPVFFVGDDDPLDLDSLVLVDLAIALEAEFDICIANEDIVRLVSVANIVQVVADNFCGNQG